MGYYKELDIDGQHEIICQNCGKKFYSPMQDVTICETCLNYNVDITDDGLPTYQCGYVDEDAIDRAIEQKHFGEG